MILVVLSELLTQLSTVNLTSICSLDQHSMELTYLCFWNLILVNMALGGNLCNLQHEQLKTNFKFLPCGVASGANCSRSLLCLHFHSHHHGKCVKLPKRQKHTRRYLPYKLQGFFPPKYGLKTTTTTTKRDLILAANATTKPTTFLRSYDGQPSSGLYNFTFMNTSA